jgi:hypothetical protein
MLISPVRADSKDRPIARKTGNDTREDQHRDTVAHTTLGDLLTQPHHEHRTGHEGGDGDEMEAEVTENATPCWPDQWTCQWLEPAPG